MLIVSFASVFGWILIYEWVPAMLTELLTGISDKRYVILLILNVFILILGCFMEGISVLLITVPVLLPLLTTLGIDLMNSGVILDLNLNIGLITPLLGVLIFVLLSITFIPQTTLFLPGLDCSAIEKGGGYEICS